MSTASFKSATCRAEEGLALELPALAVSSSYRLRLLASSSLAVGRGTNRRTSLVMCGRSRWGGGRLSSREDLVRGLACERSALHLQGSVASNRVDHPLLQTYP